MNYEERWGLLKNHLIKKQAELKEEMEQYEKLHFAVLREKAYFYFRNYSKVIKKMEEIEKI